MDSEAPVSSPVEQPQDNSGGGGGATATQPSEDPPSGGDDGFETASDPDADDSAALPAAPIAVEDEDSTDKNPNSEGNSPAKSSPPALSADAGVLKEEKATADAAEENWVPGSEGAGPVAAVDEPDAVEPVIDEEKKAVGDVQDEKFEDAPEEVAELVPVGSLAGIRDCGVTVADDEGDGNSSKEEVVVVAGDKGGEADAALMQAEVDGNLKPESKALGVQEEVPDSGLLKEGNGVPDTGKEKDNSLVDGESAPIADSDAGAVVASELTVEVTDVGKVVAGDGKDVLDAVDENSEESPSTAVEGVDELKTVGDVVAIGSDGVPDALKAKDESLGVSGSQSSSTIQGSEGSSSSRDELVAADDAGSKQNIEAVADLKALDVESDYAIEVEKGGGTVAAYRSDILNEGIDSKLVEAESSVAENGKAGADSDASSDQRLVMVNDSSLELPELEVTEPRVGPAGAGNGEVSVEGSLAVDFESAHSLDSADKPDGRKAIVDVGVDVKDGFVSEKGNDSADKHDVASDGEGVVDEGVVPESSDLISVQGMESSPVLEEKPKSGEVEPVFFLDRAVKPEGVGAQAEGEDVEDDKVMPESSDLISVHGVESSPVLEEVSKSGEVEPVSFSDRAVKPEAVRAQDDGEGVEDEKMVPESVDLIPVQGVESSPVLEEESKGGEVEPVSFLNLAVKPETVGAEAAAASTDDKKLGLDETEEEGLVSEGPARVAILESSETAKLIIKEMEEGSASSHSGFRSSGEHSEDMDGQIVSDSEDEADTDEEGEGRELFDSAALTALLKAATGSADGGVTISQDSTRIFTVDRPAGLGSSIPALRPAALRSSRPSTFSPSDLSVVGQPENVMDENDKKLQEKVEQIRIKFLRLVQRLGHSPDDTVAAQVLYRLGLAEGIRRGRQVGRSLSIESTKKKALQLEEDKKEDLEFSCNILVLGKTGVGKSATINSIFGESKSHTNAFLPATTSVREITGTVDGVKIRVVDTPGLRASVMDQAANKKVLRSIKKYTKRCPPDIVLYVDRIDTQTRDFNDLPLLRSVTTILGSSIWFNAIVALSHAASAPPDGPSGSPLSYEVFVAQRSHVVQHSIRQAAGDMRLMNPVALVENHPSCRRNREGERVLPNGLSWRPQLLLLCYSSKILSEANSLLKLQDPSPGKLFGFRLRSPPLPYLLSSLLQSRTHPKLSTDQGGDIGDSDIDLDDLSDTDQEEEDEYDQLPPFKPLRKAQIAKLTRDQRRAYLDEYDYRVKLLQKKQWKEELRRMKEAKVKGKTLKDDFAYGDMMDDYDQDGAPAAVPVPLPDMVLPPSFDCNNPVYRYRFLEPTSQLLIRPVLDSHGWDHDCGYDGVSIEENLAVAGRFPAGVAVQITKDKKEFNLHMDSSISAKHGENGSSLAGFDIQSIGKQLAYIVRGETKFKNLKKNKTAAGVSVTFLGETVATGLKVEDQFSVGRRVNLVASAGGVQAQGDVAYGANLEARLRDKDYPLGQTLSTLGLSLMKWRSDLALGANLQSQFSIGRNSKMAVRVGLNNKLSGQITVRTSTSEQLQIALVAILPLAISFFRSISPGESYMVN